MGEDTLDDDGVIDRGHQLHPPGAARTAQDSKPKARRISAAHVQ